MGKGPIFIFSGPIKLFLKIAALFAKHGISSWISIRVMLLCFFVGFQKRNIDSLMPFSVFFCWILKMCYY
jgi:hypothetical protein